MKFSTVLTAITSASLAAAKPISKRELGGVLLCTGANATGTCEHVVYPLETCVNVTAPFYQNAATFAPDGEEFFCYPYIMPCGGLCTSPTGCTMGPVDFTYKNKFNMSVTGWDHYLSSVTCHQGPTPSGFY
ncbi:hypothetical protein UCRPA7_377 [Phaeoacremonium minimum UCRPA7]|uniref:Small secreted protein n=1 Tax=Phaeoacremonium minimum (strain UCR-PA7) TaxID=1286976 RepID=R8BXG1_PHAM7|nr:hypothetical protein UCRPA7_377 [Phaeoacremonium minimum UCRPA7]EOO04091.1 hypothetical protein UCRPA7_377 [Phaeoacremonium minimum UCRPA7]